jgi:hypothetical protein
MMKLRLTLSAILWLAKQAFSGQRAPLICADIQASGYSSSVRFAINIIELLIIFGVPTLAAILYAHFGWPKQKSGPMDRPRQNN